MIREGEKRKDLKIELRGWGDGVIVKSANGSYSRPEFSSPPTLGGSQGPVTTAPGNRMLFSDHLRHCAYMHNTNPSHTPKGMMM